jgi:hypothetical protein
MYGECKTCKFFVEREVYGNIVREWICHAKKAGTFPKNIQPCWIKRDESEPNKGEIAIIRGDG